MRSFNDNEDCTLTGGNLILGKINIPSIMNVDIYTCARRFPAYSVGITLPWVGNARCTCR